LFVLISSLQIVNRLITVKKIIKHPSSTFIQSETSCDLTQTVVISSSLSVQNIAEVSGKGEDTSLNSVIFTE